MADYSKTIWNYLINKIGNEYGVAGLMGNLQAESGLQPHRLQGDFTTGYTTSVTYTANVDNGTISRDDFIYNGPGGGGYGLAQWTYSTRKADLYDKWKNEGYSSIGSIDLALDYLWWELNNRSEFKSVLSTLKSATSIREASDKVLHDFENPADQSTSVEETRNSLSQAWYDRYTGTGGTGGDTYTGIKKIYLSPSSQWSNAYAYGDTVEAEQCQRIADKLGEILTGYGFTVKVGSNNSTITERINESNSFGAELHIPIHTNAGGGSGALVLCHPNNTENKFVVAVYNELCDLVDNTDDGIRANSELPEIMNVNALTIYTEAEFHDNVEGAKFIIENYDKIAQAIANGIVTANGGKPNDTGGDGGGEDNPDNPDNPPVNPSRPRKANGMSLLLMAIASDNF